MSVKYVVGFDKKNGKGILFSKSGKIIQAGDWKNDVHIEPQNTKNELHKQGN